MAPFVSIIVPVFKQWHLVPNLLRCIERQSYQKFELLLVDNGLSEVPDLTDASVVVKHLFCKAPGSYATRNLGAAKAKGELLAFTDADCSPSEDWLSCAIAEYLRSSSKSTIIAGAVEMSPRITSSPNIYEMYDMALGIPQAWYVKRGYAATANLFAPIDLFRELSGFDSNRFSGGDSDFCKRSVSFGARLIYCPEALVKHNARDNLNAHIAKVQRIKGGQLLNGSFRSRFTWGIRAFLPPLRAWFRVLQVRDLRFSDRLLICRLQFRLWRAEMLEVIRLIAFRKKPNR